MALLFKLLSSTVQSNYNCTLLCIIMHITVQLHGKSCCVSHCVAACIHVHIQHSQACPIIMYKAKIVPVSQVVWLHVLLNTWRRGHSVQYRVGNNLIVNIKKPFNPQMPENWVWHASFYITYLSTYVSRLTVVSREASMHLHLLAYIHVSYLHKRQL